MATVKVNIGSDGTVGLAPNNSEDDVGCECNKESWPLVILCLGFGNAFFVCLVAILSLLQLQAIVLSAYIIVLSLVGLMAEFRRIKCLRGVFYHILKFVYFLTNYYCRGVYHIFIGSILLSDVPLTLIAGCVSIAFGILLIGVHTVIGLPNYVDWQVAKADGARAAALAGTTPIAAAAYSPTATPTAGNTSDDPYSSGGYYSNPQPSYEPAPTSSIVGSSAYVPPATNTAYMAQGKIEDPYDEEPITSAPASRARMNNNDDALAAAYYAQQQAAAAQQQPTTRATRNIDYDDPFARDDSQYKPNRQ